MKQLELQDKLQKLELEYKEKKRKLIAEYKRLPSWSSAKVGDEFICKISCDVHEKSQKRTIKEIVPQRVRLAIIFTDDSSLFVFGEDIIE